MKLDEFKSFPNCGHYTDEQAYHIIQNLEKLAIILFDHTAQKNGTLIDNQLVTNNTEEKCTQQAA